ncbi:hypothetical protein Scep_023023 [Stephania cephalantha]|uniref:Uncharacterized protein n=1 Tax=Stephania cephalantha TaxID=152367 RepID=A0AAP0FJR9_9MAGN
MSISLCSFMRSHSYRALFYHSTSDYMHATFFLALRFGCFVMHVFESGGG